MNMNELRVNFDDCVTMYVIEENDNWEMSQLSQEEQEALNKQNDVFILKYLEPTIMRNFSICNCQMKAFVDRNESRRQLMNTPVQMYVPSYEQSDLDNFHYGVVLTSKNGVFDKVKFIVTTCKSCGIMQIRGDGEIVTRLLTECTKNYMDAVAAMAKKHEKEESQTTSNVVEFPIDKVAVETEETDQ